MSTQKFSKKMRELLYNHDNDYGFSPFELQEYSFSDISNLTIIIPYFEAGQIINITLNHLYNAIEKTKNHYPNWRYEVLLFDDGSNNFPVKKLLDPKDWNNLSIFSSSINRGRTLTRNQGLLKAKFKKCLFMDCDIFIDRMLLLNHLWLHSLCYVIKQQECITISFFKNSSNKSVLKVKDIRLNYEELNDFRINCTYKKEWIGCAADKNFISKTYALLQHTNYFKSWKGMVGPWCLANMVLGGFFMIDRKPSLEVNGFDSMFLDYGFTETSLPTKLIALKNFYLIPQMRGGAIHFVGNPAHLTPNKKNKFFRLAHRLYFKNYLELSINEAITNPLVGWG